MRESRSDIDCDGVAHEKQDRQKGGQQPYQGRLTEFAYTEVHSVSREIRREGSARHDMWEGVSRVISARILPRRSFARLGGGAGKHDATRLSIRVQKEGVFHKAKKERGVAQAEKGRQPGAAFNRRRKNNCRIRNVPASEAAEGESRGGKRGL